MQYVTVDSHQGLILNHISFKKKKVWVILTDRLGNRSLYVQSGITSKCLKLIQLSYLKSILSLRCCHLHCFVFSQPLG